MSRLTGFVAFCRIVVATVLLGCGLDQAFAGPPSGCAKFVGAWTVRVLATGQTYPGLILPNGTTQVTCPMCTPTGTWSCSGNTITVLVNGMTVSHTLAPDGRTMSGGCCTLTRVGRAPAVAAEAPQKQAPQQQAATSPQSASAPKPSPPPKQAVKPSPSPAQQQTADPPSNTGQQQSASCSDITGTSGGGPTVTNCRSGNSLLAAARAVRAQNPAAAAETYKQAADAYHRAGDIALANTILQEAFSLVVASAPNLPPTQGSGASEPPPTTPAAAGSIKIPSHWNGTSDPADCAAANDLEHGTAAWYDSCVPLSADDDAYRSRMTGRQQYTPPISPQALTALALTACKDVRGEDQRSCVDDAKVKMLLADDATVRSACATIADSIARHNQVDSAHSWVCGPDPDVRSACSSIPGDEQIFCIDAAYLYGPALPSTLELRYKLAKSLSSANADQPAPTAQGATPTQPAQLTARDRCHSGEGKKPTPGGFGSTSCQPLGVIYLAPNRRPGTSQAGGSADAPDPVAVFEQRVNEIAALVTEAIANTPDAPSSAADRATCMEVATVAARSMLKGGAPSVPPMCREMTNAARSELVYYSGHGLGGLNSGTEELLAYLSIRNPASGGSIGGNLGPPLPGMMDLEPSAENRRQADCVVRGGTVENCAAAIAAPRSAAPKPADCAQAGAHWKSAEEIKTLAVYQDHLARFPNCAFATLATARMAALGQQDTPSTAPRGAISKTCAAGFAADSDGDCVRQKPQKNTTTRKPTSRTSAESAGANKDNQVLDCTNPAGLLACANRALSTVPVVGSH